MKAASDCASRAEKRPTVSGEFAAQLFRQRPKHSAAMAEPPMSRQHLRYGFILVVQNLGLSNPFSAVILSYPDIWDCSSGIDYDLVSR